MVSLIHQNTIIVHLLKLKKKNHKPFEINMKMGISSLFYNHSI